MSEQISFYTLIISATIEIVVEWILSKSVPFLLDPYYQLFKEFCYNRKLNKKKRYKKWGESDKNFIVLRAAEIRNQIEQSSKSVIVLLNKFLSLGNSEPIVLTGSSGAGKTSALESFTFQAAKSNLKRQKYIFWVIFLGSFPFFNSRIALFLYIIIFGFCIRLTPYLIKPLRSIKNKINKYIELPSNLSLSLTPIFIDARSGYAGGDVKEWCSKKVEELLGKRKLKFDEYDGIVWVIDGINEISCTLYSTFIEGWRSIIQDHPTIPVVFSSRSDQTPIKNLGLKISINLISLDDEEVKEFINLYRNLKDENLIYNNLIENKLLEKNGIGRNPYWLKMLVESEFYTLNSGILLQRFSNNLLQREIEEKPEERKRNIAWKNIVPREIEITALSNLAFAMYEEERIGFNNLEGWNKAKEVVKKTLINLPYTEDDVFKEAEAATLLVATTNEHIEFVHQLIQEYFVALYFHNAIQKTDEIDFSSHLKNILGKNYLGRDINEILLMLIGISENKMAIINWLANQIIQKRHKPFITLLRNSLEISNETENTNISSKVVSLLLSLPNSPDIHIRWDTVVVLGEMKNANSLEPLMIDLLDSNNHGRKKFLENVYNKDNSRTEDLISLLNNPNNSLKKYAIKMLEISKSQSAIEPLLIALDDKDPNIRWQIICALSKIGDNRALLKLKHIAENDETFAYSKFLLADSAKEAIECIRKRTG